MGSVIPFATSCDMIPLLYPLYCIDRDISFTRAMIDSVPLHGHAITISQNLRRDLLAFRQDFDPSKAHAAYPAASDFFRPDITAE